MIRYTKHLLVLYGIAMLVSPCAYGYVDPGAGHMILQLMIAAGFGCIFYAKKWIALVLGFFPLRKKATKKN